MVKLFSLMLRFGGGTHVVGNVVASGEQRKAGMSRSTSGIGHWTVTMSTTGIKNRLWKERHMQLFSF